MSISKTVKYLFVFLIIAPVCSAQSRAQTSDDNVVVQMNYCISTLTNIIHNKSMSVLEHESDQLINNLTMEQIIGLNEIKDFRIELMDAVGKFEITEEERLLTRRIQSIKRDNMKWAALSSALNPTMLLTGSAGPGMAYQMAFQVLLTAARSAVEYNTMQGEQNIEELQAMWELRKEDMQNINELRKYAQSVVYELYNKYNLSENDRLTEATANMFSSFIAEPDAAKRIRVLEDNHETYKKIASYYYYLGMAYLDMDNYEQAKSNFLIYLDMYKRTPILRYDERSGCIALSILAYQKDLTNQEKEDLIIAATTNLPNNSAAALQSAMVYIYELNQEEKGLQLIRAGLDNPRASDRNILFMASANMMPLIKKYPDVKIAVSDAFTKANLVSFDSYATFTSFKTQTAWSDFAELINYSKYSSRNWYTLWITKGFMNNIHLTLPENISFDMNDIYIYNEKHKKDNVSITRLTPNFVNCITEKNIQKVSCFKANKNLKYLFVESISPGIYKLKKHIDLNKIKDESWPRMSEFVLSSGDVKDIMKFCKKHISRNSKTELKLKPYKGKFVEMDVLDSFSCEFKGDTLLYKPYHSIKQEGDYIRLVFTNGLQLVYKYDNDDDILQPYLYLNGGDVQFANNDAKFEYLFTEVPQVKKPSWRSNIWSSITGVFSKKNHDQERVTKDKDETTISNIRSWLSNTWASIKSFFSSKKSKETELDKSSK